MSLTLAEKIIRTHIVKGEPVAGREIAVRIDQTLTQDATGTMVYLQFEQLGVDRVRTERSVSYVDHNTLQAGFENADDHRYLRTVAARYGVSFSKAGNGICHQIHLERFARPGATLLGSDSHTPTSGGLGMLGIGAGGVDVALAMAGVPFRMTMPSIVKVVLTGELPPWVSSKDVILEILRRLGVRGGVGKILEYTGPGLRALSVPERATVANMGAELGATSSLFPSDSVAQGFLSAQRRESDWVELFPDPECGYSEELEVDLNSLQPLVARPHAPDNVCAVDEIAGMRIDQVVIGSCTNSSYKDLMMTAETLRGKKVHPRVSMVISPGSRQVMEMIARNGALAEIISAGARVLENACGPCIGMGQAPPTGGVSLRTINRNFKGRCGTADSEVYLVSPEVAVASAIRGELTDPRTMGRAPKVRLPGHFLIDDSLILQPPDDGSRISVIKGPNIAPLPECGALPDSLNGVVLLKVGDNITTDDIIPAGAAVLPLRSNIPKLSQFAFSGIDPGFAERAGKAGEELKAGVIAGGENYGQGSSREHAAIVCMYLGVRVVVAVSFSRIHRSNLINFGIVPVLFLEDRQYEAVAQGDSMVFHDLAAEIAGGDTVRAVNETRGERMDLKVDLSERERKVLSAGGKLRYAKGRLGTAAR
ncbi:MAG: aconitate hydratase [Candidatus Tritonobacter lacicola]|nr:aconitate hydratase [Candidatus Tritonobacter lacicola]